MKTTCFSAATWLIVAFIFEMGKAFRIASVSQRQRFAWNQLFLLKPSSDDDNDESWISSRRDLLAKLPPSAVLTFACLTQPAHIALAADPIRVEEVQNLGSIFQRAIRPKPPKVLRPRLDKDFAVLLMRSSYDALDALDCVPMDQFQRDFFIIRKSEYQPYVDALGPGLIQQGDLTDPFYFDFISFAQYKTINREITDNPPSVFEEKQPVEVGENEPQQFKTTLVRRDPSMRNEMLSSEHSRMVGTKILERLEAVFGDGAASLPKLSPNSRPDAVALLASLEQLVKIFLVNGFSWSGSAFALAPGSGVDASGTKFCLELVSPATIWGGKALQIQRSDCSNDFLLKTATVLLNRLGYAVISPVVEYDGTTQRTSFSVR